MKAERHIWWYFIVALGFSAWIAYLSWSMGDENISILIPLSPSIIAIIFTAFSSGRVGLRRLLRENVSDTEISAAVTSIWQTRRDRYSEIRSAETVPFRKVEMSYIGG